MTGSTFLIIFYVTWLCAVLVLLWLIWRSSTKHIHRMEQVVLDVTLRSAEAAIKSAEAAQAAAAAARTLAESQQEKGHEPR